MIAMLPPTITEDFDLAASAHAVLSMWNLQEYAETFLASGDGLAILANLCNASAKRCYDLEEANCLVDDLYWFKPRFVRSAIDAYKVAGQDCAWSGDGVIYLETATVQVSFHVFSTEDDWSDVPHSEERAWSGLHMQPIALELAIAHVLGWHYDEHKNALPLIARRVEDADEPVTWLVPGAHLSVCVDDNDEICFMWFFSRTVVH